LSISTKLNSADGSTTTTSQPQPRPSLAAIQESSETPLEALSSICVILAAGLFVMAFVFQNFEIPSPSMTKTLLVGDHVVVDRITIAPPTRWMPLVHYRPIRRGDIIVFMKPNPETPDLILVKRTIGIPGDRIHLRGGIVYVNGVALPIGYARRRPATDGVVARGAAVAHSPRPRRRRPRCSPGQGLRYGRQSRAKPGRPLLGVCS
jgi:signal peptidase I